MPHQCVRCNNFYDDGAKELLNGCPCGGKLFFFIKKENLDAMQKASEDLSLSDEDKKQIENDVFDIVGSEIDAGQPVILDFEAIRVDKPGKYRIDLVQLFKKEPVVFQLEEGKYMIDLVESFDRFRKK
ncbi:hypothetical protein J4212_08310 [Candidatus Woesearchaeota archaeon]|nr:hypothetical protein [Candidatus Woesearchaeota archaeon]